MRMKHVFAAALVFAAFGTGSVVAQPAAVKKND